MRTVHQVSELTGVSIRTLHHYDAIGLLKPAKITEAGYRLYDDQAIRRLQQILIYRELQFSLRDIREMLDSPAFDPTLALEQQIALLEMQRSRLAELISFARDIQTKGAEAMTWEVFDKKEYEKQQEEARARWGQTPSWQEYTERKKNHPDAQQSADALMVLLGSFGQLRSEAADGQAVQKRVADLQQLITDSFYTCTKEILQSLGEMYAADERFRRNIDRAGGEGTADFVSKAIGIYCRT